MGLINNTQKIQHNNRSDAQLTAQALLFTADPDYVTPPPPSFSEHHKFVFAINTKCNPDLFSNAGNLDINGILKKRLLSPPSLSLRSGDFKYTFPKFVVKAIIKSLTNIKESNHYSFIDNCKQYQSERTTPTNHMVDELSYLYFEGPAVKFKYGLYLNDGMVLLGNNASKPFILCTLKDLINYYQVKVYRADDTLHIVPGTKRVQAGTQLSTGKLGQLSQSTAYPIRKNSACYLM